jgi:arylsulfatase A-like enzyme
VKASSLFFVLAFIACQPSAPENSSPDILLILADDLGVGDMSWAGGEARMPRLELLRSQGTELTSFRTFPLCTPTRVALMTGKSPVDLGLLYSPLRPWDARGLPTEEITLAERLQKKGYETALIGKWHLGHEKKSMHPNQQGFQHFYGFLTGAIDYWSHESRDGGLDWQRNGTSLSEKGYATRLFAKEAESWIASVPKEKPIFLYLPLSAPHIPLQAPSETVEHYKTLANKEHQIYCAMIEEMDSAIAKVLKATKARKKETLIIFLGDNGPARGHGARTGHLRGAKGSTFEGGLRVPALLSFSSAENLPATFSKNTDVLDFAATLLAVGGDNPEGLPGRNLLPPLTKGSPLSSRTQFFAACSPQWTTYAVIKNSWKYVLRIHRDNGLEKELYYSLVDDPAEKFNLAETHKNEVGLLREQLTQWVRRHPGNPDLSLTPDCSGPAPKDWTPPKDWATYR